MIKPKSIKKICISRKELNKIVENKIFEILKQSKDEADEFNEYIG